MNRASSHPADLLGADADPGQPPSSGSWSSAWRSAMRPPGSRLAIAWLGFVALMAVLAPALSSGHPLMLRRLDASGAVLDTSFPLWEHLTRIDVLLLFAAGLAAPAWFLGRWLRCQRALLAAALAGALAAASFHPGAPALQTFDQYPSRTGGGPSTCVYTLNPWSPAQRDPQHRLLPPGATADRHTVWLGTDALGQDVLSQMLHACRLALSVGLIATGCSVLIGVAMGALMGYFGGWVDALLMRVVEIFMSIPTLLLLVTAAAVLPRNTYVLMAVIGCCSWTGAARFTRAEFLRLREIDWVLAAHAAGLGTSSIVLRHILPAAITPVLVEAGFAVAAAILAEAALSYLGLGPAEQPSWGRLLSDAVSGAGEFHWWLGIFPGGAIFLTVLSANALSQAMREAMSPKDHA